MRSVAAIPWLLVLCSCSSPPKPPTVDESQKRPVNSPSAIDLQVCRTDLQNTRILALENGRAAQASGSIVARLVQQQALATAAATSAPADIAPAPLPVNTVRTVHFGFGSAQVALPADELDRLADDARAAPLIVLRGRTDGTSDAPAESRIARQRAEAVRALLLQAGVDPARIRTTWQPSGDQVADNGSSAGRALNRRVEIEIYRTAPKAVPFDLPPTAATAR